EGAVISVAYFGDQDEGREAVAPLLEDPAPLFAGLRPMYYPELQEIFGRMPFGLRNYWSGRFLGELPDELIEQSAARMQPSDVYGSVMFEPLFGAAARVSPEATAFSGREASYNATYINVWTDAAEDEAKIAAARDFTASLASWALGAYVNYAFDTTGDGML